MPQQQPQKGFITEIFGNPNKTTKAKRQKENCDKKYK